MSVCIAEFHLRRGEKKNHCGCTFSILICIVWSCLAAASSLEAMEDSDEDYNFETDFN